MTDLELTRDLQNRFRNAEFFRWVYDLATESPALFQENITQRPTHLRSLVHRVIDQVCAILLNNPVFDVATSPTFMAIDRDENFVPSCVLAQKVASFELSGIEETDANFITDILTRFYTELATQDPIPHRIYLYELFIPYWDKGTNRIDILTRYGKI